MCLIASCHRACLSDVHAIGVYYGTIHNSFALGPLKYAIKIMLSVVFMVRQVMGTKVLWEYTI
jgi:hypothetical protein